MFRWINLGFSRAKLRAARKRFSLKQELAKMARFMDKNVDGIDVPEAVIARMEEGVSGIDIARDFISRIIDTADGIHIMAMGNVEGRIGRINKFLIFPEYIIHFRNKQRWHNYH